MCGRFGQGSCLVSYGRLPFSRLASLTPCRGLAAPSVATFMTWDWFAGGHFNLRDRARPNPEHRRGWLLCNAEEGWTWRRGDGEREEPDSGVGRHDSKLLCLLHWCSRHGHPLTSTLCSSHSWAGTDPDARRQQKYASITTIHLPALREQLQRTSQSFYSACSRPSSHLHAHRRICMP